MITPIGKHYLYRHIRLDTGEPFYIGIGTKNTLDKNSATISVIYRRAFSKNDRSCFWKRVVAKTNYEVEILLESDDYEFIKQKEVEFIALYGRRNLEQGLLTNLTDGGGGSVGYVYSEEQRKTVSLRFKGRSGESHHLSKKVFVYTMNGDFIKEFPSRRQCALSLNVDKGCVDQSLAGKITQCFGYVFKEEYLGEKIPKTLKKGWKAVEVLDKDSLEILWVFDSVTKASSFLGTSTTNISRGCKNINVIVKGYRMRYKEISNIEDSQNES
jgi:hypothetical protein